jgi:hypothetical protein
MTSDLNDKEQERLDLFLKVLDSGIDVEPRWLKPPKYTHQVWTTH